MAALDDALEQLYRAPLASFTAERTTLAASLRAGGDKAAAADLAKRRRPTIGAWAVNQLWWEARDAFDEMLATAARLRTGDLDAVAAHRDAMTRLRKRAAGILEQAGHGSTDAVLRRVGTTLVAIAAAGFEPDAPGTLAAERDPPGFDALVLPAEGRRIARTAPAVAPPKADDQARKRAEADEAKRRAEAARRREQRDALGAELRDAKRTLEEREHTLAALQKDLRAAETALTKARDDVARIERRLAALRDEA